MLLGQRRFAVIATGAVVLSVMIGLTVLRYGWLPWAQFLTITTGNQLEVIESWRGQLQATVPTWFMQGRLLNADFPVAYALHFGLAATTLVLLVRAWPGQKGDLREWLTWLVCGSFLLLPYAYVYDLVIYQAMLAFWRREPGALFARGNGILSQMFWVLGWVAPALTIVTAALYSVHVLPFYLLYLLWRRGIAARREPAEPADPAALHTSG
jgi:hypothetical protein